MEKIRNKCILALTALLMTMSLLMSCDSKNDINKGRLVGKWTLESLESEINGIPDATGKVDNFEGLIYCEFFDDSTYVLNDGEAEERGTWVLKDSLLGMLLQGIENDSSNYTWYKIESLSDTFLVKKSNTNSDCGIITETSKYRKVEE